MEKGKRTKRQTTIYKTLHRKLKIEQYEPLLTTGSELRCSRRVGIPALLVTPVVLP